MTRPAPKLAAEPPPGKGTRLDVPGPEFSLLWAALARLPWNALVLVPCEEGQSAGPIAAGLAGVGQRLCATPVTSMLADQLDYTSAAQFTSRVAAACSVSRTIAPAGKVIAAIPAVVNEPLGVPAALAADTVILCVEVGKSHLASVRRTMALIGKDRIAGCFLVRGAERQAE